MHSDIFMTAVFVTLMAIIAIVASVSSSSFSFHFLNLVMLVVVQCLAVLKLIDSSLGKHCCDIWASSKELASCELKHVLVLRY